MKLLRKLFVLTSGFCMLIVVLSLVSSYPVAADSTKDVIVANTPLPVTGNVTVSGNSSTNPLLVRDVDNGDRAPIQVSNFDEGTQGGPQGLLAYSVPFGQRVAVEHVNVSCTLAHASDAFALGGFRLDVSGGGFAEYELPTTTGISGQVIVDVALKAYGDPGSTVFLHISGISSGGPGDFPAGSHCSAAFSGHTVSVP